MSQRPPDPPSNPAFLPPGQLPLPPPGSRYFPTLLENLSTPSHALSPIQYQPLPRVASTNLASPVPPPRSISRAPPPFVAESRLQPVFSPPSDDGIPDDNIPVGGSAVNRAGLEEEAQGQHQLFSPVQAVTRRKAELERAIRIAKGRVRSGETRLAEREAELAQAKSARPHDRERVNCLDKSVRNARSHLKNKTRPRVTELEAELKLAEQELGTLQLGQ
ncbi:hypothetical protein JCM3765_002028 [Sporobolomyces pararoseus]